MPDRDNQITNGEVLEAIAQLEDRLRTANATRPRRPFAEQVGEAVEIARAAFAEGNNVVGLAAIAFATQLFELARIQESMKP